MDGRSGGMRDFVPRAGRNCALARGAMGWLRGTALALVLAALIPGGADAASVIVRSSGTGLSTIPAGVGDVIDLEVVIDSEGLTIEGWGIGVDFTGGGVDILSETPTVFPGFFAMGTTIDNTANTIRNITQFSFPPTFLAAGVHVVSQISVEVTSLLGGPIVVTPGLFGGDVLGLDDGTCPGTVPDCTVSFSAATIPEPSTTALVGLALLGLAARRIAGRRG